MKLQKIITAALFTLIGTQAMIASELSIGEGAITLDPHYVQESITFDSEANSFMMHVSSSNELEVDESVPCEDHFSFPLTGAFIDKGNSSVVLSVNGENRTIGSLNGKGTWVKLNDDVFVNYNKNYSSEGSKVLEVSLQMK